jgi:hypothetical protein
MIEVMLSFLMFSLFCLLSLCLLLTVSLLSAFPLLSMSYVLSLPSALGGTELTTPAHASVTMLGLPA